MQNDHGRLRKLTSLAAVFLILVLCGAWLRGGGTGGGRIRAGLFAGGSANLPDFSTVADVKARKLQFFTYLLPLVDQQNEQLQQQRRRLEHIRDRLWYDDKLSRRDRKWTEGMAERFKIAEVDLEQKSFWTALLQRVDTVPTQLVLIQAANESAWGTSRFAREGNNLFGQWCFQPGCGIVPADRPAGAIHEVARFPSVGEAIAAYMRNLNTGATYVELRAIRARIREARQIPHADALAAGLLMYSERRMAYVDDIRVMIRQNETLIAQARRDLGGGEI